MLSTKIGLGKEHKIIFAKSQFSLGKWLKKQKNTNEKKGVPLGHCYDFVNIIIAFPSQKFLRIQVNLYF